jgi:hypothetical protein
MRRSLQRYRRRNPWSAHKVRRHSKRANRMRSRNPFYSHRRRLKRNPITRPTQVNDIFAQPTQILFDESDAVSRGQLNDMRQTVRDGMNWKALATTLSEEMPGMRDMLSRGLRNAFREREVQEKLNGFLTALAATADRRLLSMRRYR